MVKFLVCFIQLPERVVLLVDYVFAKDLTTSAEMSTGFFPDREGIFPLLQGEKTRSHEGKKLS